MDEYTVFATLGIKASGTGESEQDVLDKSVKAKDYEVLSCTIDHQLDRKYISLSEYAEKYNTCAIYLRRICRAGKFPGAKKIGRNWCVPVDEPWHDNRRPADGKWSEWYYKYRKPYCERKKASKREQAAPNDAE